MRPALPAAPPNIFPNQISFVKPFPICTGAPGFDISQKAPPPDVMNLLTPAALYSQSDPVLVKLPDKSQYKDDPFLPVAKLVPAIALSKMIASLGFRSTTA